MATRQSVTVFATHTAAKRDNKVRDFVRHLLHDLNSPRVLCIDERPDMQTPDTGVAVVSSAGFIFLNHVAEFHEEFRQLCRFDCAILDKCDRLALPFHAEQQSQTGFSDFPDIGLVDLVERSNVGIPRFVALQYRFHLVQL